MKICPQCFAKYDATMFFCLEDGNELTFPQNLANTVSNIEEETLVAPKFDTRIRELSNDTSKESINSVTQINNPTYQKQTSTTPPTFTDLETGNGKRNLIFGLIFGAILLTIGGFGFWLSQRPAVNQVATATPTKTPVLNNSNANTANSNVNSSNINNTNLQANSNSSLTNDSNSSSGNYSSNLTFPSSDSNSLSNSNGVVKPTAKPTATKTPAKPSVDEDSGDSYPTTSNSPKNPNNIPTTVSGGVVNGKASNLVQPIYPPAAKAVRASGTVNVQVTIDENGNVISANAVSGHVLLRSAAESAARESKFNPTILSGGQRVKVTGSIVYNFTPQ